MDKNSVVLISGCSSDSGLALAREFASQGCKVIAKAGKIDVLVNNAGYALMGAGD
jgi:NAD(P)-dependent dehydrogenase (short-subunit alcohol dehydrogenase family)